MGSRERVYLIEDDSYDAEWAQQVLEAAGHKIITWAWNMKYARERLSVAQELEMTVAVLDGNLEEESRDCEDGRIIANLIREQAPGVLIIAYSRAKKESASYGDIYVRKNPYELTKVVTEIPR